ncbi:MDR/zinc-dependent alcohol dehydrogenase-like family protein [Rhizobium mongolense]|uniref:hypothetical protein n=1 Tax=Rhizobium mongolense TaxID=57676 RepID=UPI001113AA37|nr:hypothetical protein [Rhizobium mongolense]
MDELAQNCARPCGKIGAGRSGAVRRFLSYLMDQILDRIIDPGKVFAREPSLAEVAEGYGAMDECRTIKTLRRSN